MFDIFLGKFKLLGIICMNYAIFMCFEQGIDIWQFDDSFGFSRFIFVLGVILVMIDVIWEKKES